MGHSTTIKSLERAVNKVSIRLVVIILAIALLGILPYLTAIALYVHPTPRHKIELVTGYVGVIAIIGYLLAELYPFARLVRGCSKGLGRSALAEFIRHAVCSDISYGELRRQYLDELSTLLEEQDASLRAIRAEEARAKGVETRLLRRMADLGVPETSPAYKLVSQLIRRKGERAARNYVDRQCDIAGFMRAARGIAWAEDYRPAIVALASKGDVDGLRELVEGLEAQAPIRAEAERLGVGGEASRLLLEGNIASLDDLLASAKTVKRRAAEVAALMSRHAAMPRSSLPPGIDALRAEAERCLPAEIPEREYRKAAHAYRSALDAVGR